MRDSAFGPLTVPAAFWGRPDTRHALTTRDIGAIFRLLKQHEGITQMRIATATGNAQGRISEIVNGKYHVTSVTSLTRIADGLTMPSPARILLGIAPTTSRAAEPATTRDAPGGLSYPPLASDATATIISLWSNDDSRSPGLSILAAEPDAWNAAALSWLVSPASTALPDPIPDPAVELADDLARLQTTAAVFADLDNRFGGAHSRRALIRYLRFNAAAMLTGRHSDRTRPALFTAVAETALLAAWMTYDCGQHGLAQRYFTQALRLAEAAGNRRLACSILSAMSHQATYLGHTTEAVNLARAAQTGLGRHATPTLTAQFQVMEARALARAGDGPGCHQALSAAERSFARANPARDPEFISYFNEAELAAELGHCFRDLNHGHKALTHATHAAEHSDGNYPRSDFFVSLVQAHAHADTGDPDQACRVTLAALREGEALTSSRCITYLREFRHRLTRYGDTPAIRDFREQAAAFPLWVKAS